MVLCLSVVSTTRTGKSLSCHQGGELQVKRGVKIVTGSRRHVNRPSQGDRSTKSLKEPYVKKFANGQMTVFERGKVNGPPTWSR